MSELASPKTRSQSSPLATWAVKNVRLEGRPFRFDGHEYLRAIYDDTSPHVVLSKAAQIGGTTYGILRSLHACLQGLNVIYFFPTRTDVLEFSKSRVGPLVEENPFLQRQMTDTDTAGLKRIGDAHLYLRGMQSNVGMKSVPADLIVFDELDESTPEAKSMARERISHSEYKRIIELSNPSLPDYGIDEQYQLSDQRHWTVKCPGCSDWVALDKEFPRKMGQDVRIIRQDGDGSYFRACPSCEAELDLAAGEWVADFPTRPIHGYRISQLLSSRVGAGEILHEYRTTRYPDRFYNLKIGIPWADLERRLDMMSVLSLCDEDTPMADKDDVGTAMGVDTGRELHCVIVRPQSSRNRTDDRIVHLAVCQDFAQLDELMKRFSVSCCVIDGLPETHATRAFANRHGNVFLNFFNEHQRGSAKWDRSTDMVQINRTEALDASRAVILQKKVTLPRREPIVELFAKHMAADAKVLDEDPETGAKRFRYVRVGEDHFSLAFTYAMMAVNDQFWREIPFSVISW